MRKTAIVVQSVEQLQWAERRYDLSSPSVLLVVANNAVAAALEKRAVAFTEEYDLLDLATSELNLFRAPAVASKWSARFREVARERGLGAIGDFAAELNWPIEITLNASKIYRKLLTDEHVASVILFSGGRDVAMLRNGPAPGFLPALSIARAAIRHVAESLNCDVLLHADATLLSSQRQAWRPRFDARDASGDVSGQATAPGAARRLALLWREGMWPREVQAVRLAIEALGWEAVELSQADLDAFAESLDAARPARRSLPDAISEIIAELRLEGAAECPEFFGNPHLGFQFAALANEIVKSRLLRDAFECVLNALEPATVVFAHDAFSVERSLQDASSEAQVPTVSMLHGGLAPLCGCVGLVGAADATLVWNEEDARRLALCGYSDRKFTAIGALRFDDRFRAFLNDTKSSPRSASNPATVLLLTSPPHVGLTFRTASDDDFREAWSEILRLGKSRQDLSFVIRPHPAYDQLDYYRGLVDEGGGAISLETSETIETVTARADIALLMNACSTAALDVLFARVPLLFIGNAMERSVFAGDQVRAGGIPEVTETGRIETAIDAALHDANSRAKLVNVGDQLLSAMLAGGDDGQSARERLRSALQRTVTAAPRMRDAEAPKGGPIEQGIVVSVATAVAAGGARRVGDALRSVGPRLQSIGVSRTAREHTVRGAYILAMRKSIEAGQGRAAAMLAVRGLLDPHAGIAAHRAYWSATLKALVTGYPIVRGAANWADRQLHGLLK